mmetsp:Transcript_19397/g.41316  ORF Transcript_19397/g.41316 Transcript_19397/m.41316 type:complete len:223 (+) Transcript_19397:287-955(+)
MLLIPILSTGHTQNFLMICVLCKWRSGSTNATKMYCLTFSKMSSHSSASSSSKTSGRLASSTSMCSSSKWSRGEASSCMVSVFATSRCGQVRLRLFSSYMRLLLPITYVSLPTVLSASASGGRRRRCLNAGGCSRSTVTYIGRSVGYSERRCTNAESPTCSTFFELLTTKSRLITARRLSAAASPFSSSADNSPTLLLALPSSPPCSTDCSWRSAKEILPSK